MATRILLVDDDTKILGLLQRGLAYEGTALAHPLMPRGKCVANDLHLGPDMCLLVVSGAHTPATPRPAGHRHARPRWV